MYDEEVARYFLGHRERQEGDLIDSCGKVEGGNGEIWWVLFKRHVYCLYVYDPKENDGAWLDTYSISGRMPYVFLGTNRWPCLGKARQNRDRYLEEVSRR